MPRAAPALLSFSSGELSRLFDGRVDLEEYPSGCRKVENFLPLIQGPATRRGGTRFVKEVKDSSDRTGSLRFEFNTEQAYFLEVGDQYIRFYTDHGVVLNGTNPLELATPWAAADLFDSSGHFKLRAVQTGDVMHITHIDGDYQSQKLTRSGALSWSIADFEPEGGPFEDIDPDETVTVYASAETGNVTLTASSAIFAATRIGSLILLEQNTADDIPAWEAAKAVSVGQLRRVDNRVYVSATAGTTGTVTPTHTVGSAMDGNAGVQWTFRHAGYGWARITARASSGLTATATVLSRLPTGVVGSGEKTTRWAFGAWSDAEGYPTHVTIFRERLTFAKATTREFWMSESGDFERFRSRDDGGEIVADSAIRGTVESDKSNPIMWMVPGDKLLIGTAGEEFAVGEITSSEPLGPGNCKAYPQTSYGSKPVRPVFAGDALLFVQRSGRKLRDLRFSIEKGESGGLVSSNLSTLAPHFFPKGLSLIGLAYQQEPYSVVWGWRSDGLLVAATLNANKRTFGWHRHPLGGDGVVEAAEVIPSPDGDSDELWLIVKRTINGSTKRYVEYMEPDWNGGEHEDDQGEDIIEAFYVDSGLTYDGKVNATLTPGTGALTAGTEEVTFTAGSGVFVSGDVGREIWYRYFDEDADEGEYPYKTARAEITSRTSSTVVKATILSAWPSLTAISANLWRMTVTTISGLTHLQGSTVDILADGASHPQKTVAAGAITLERKATYVHVGLPCPCKIQPMGVEAGSADGTAQGKTKRAHKMGFRFLNTVGGRAGPAEDSLDEIMFRDASMDMDEGIPPFTGDKQLPWPDGYTTDIAPVYVNDDPLPATVIAFLPRMVTSDS